MNVGDTTSAALSGLEIGTTYYWQARAVNPYGNTEANGGTWWSFTTEVILPGPFAKSSPTNGADGQPTSLSLVWGASADATSYEYCIDTTNNGACDGAWSNVGNTTSTALAGLAQATTYYWQVRAVNSLGDTEADGGAWWSFTTLVPAPEAFGKVAPEDGAVSQPLDLTLSWEASTFATGYEYCIVSADDPNCDDWTSVGDSTSVQPAGLVEMGTYYWQVRAVNTSGSIEADGGTWWEFTSTPLLFGDGSETGNLDRWSVVYP
jgi:predicted phage tail protein